MLSISAGMLPAPGGFLFFDLFSDVSISSAEGVSNMSCVFPFDVLLRLVAVKVTHSLSLLPLYNLTKCLTHLPSISSCSLNLFSSHVNSVLKFSAFMLFP
jgi:hypothetical protein